MKFLMQKAEGTCQRKAKGVSHAKGKGYLQKVSRLETYFLMKKAEGTFKMQV